MKEENDPWWLAATVTAAIDNGREEEQEGALLMVAKRCVDGGARVDCGGGRAMPLIAIREWTISTLNN